MGFLDRWRLRKIKERIETYKELSRLKNEDKLKEAVFAARQEASASILEMNKALEITDENGDKIGIETLNALSLKELTDLMEMCVNEFEKAI